jgi:hypothetical protein
MMEANMKICTAASRLILAAGQISTLRDAQGTQIECLSGSLWITQVGEGRDVVLGPGEQTSLDRKGETVVQALRQSIVLVTELRAPAPAAPLWRRMTGALLGHFMRLGMSRSAWRSAYRI